MNEHLRILELASRNALPSQIGEDSELSIAIVGELVEAGHLQAIDASSAEGVAYLSPEITLSGREYLQKLHREISDPEGDSGTSVHAQYGVGSVELTGWPKADRTLGEIRSRLTGARTEEHFQAVGLHCREAIISLAQAIHDSEKHPPLDESKPSEKAARRVLDAFFAAELGEQQDKLARQHARAAVALTAGLERQGTSSFRQAALCVEATCSVIHIAAIVSGHRDPSKG